MIPTVPARFRVPGWRDEPLLARVLEDSLPRKNWGWAALTIVGLSAPMFMVLALVSLAYASDLCDYDNDARCMGALAGGTLVPLLGLLGSSLPLAIYGVLRHRGPSFVRVLRDRASEVVEVRVRRIDLAQGIPRGEVTLVLATGPHHRLETRSSEVLDGLVTELAQLVPKIGSRG